MRRELAVEQVEHAANLRFGVRLHLIQERHAVVCALRVRHAHQLRLQRVPYLMDMDGVLVREEDPIPGAADFIARLRAADSAAADCSNAFQMRLCR